MAQVAGELDAYETVIYEASHALIEADTAHCVAYVLRAAALLERRGSLVDAFAADVARTEVNIEARRATVEALRLELQLGAAGLGGVDTAALNAAAAVKSAGDREAAEKAGARDLRYRPAMLLRYVAHFAVTCHDPRHALWTVVLGLVSKTNIFILKSQKRRLNSYHAHRIAAGTKTTVTLRNDILVGLASSGDVRAVRDLLGRDFCADAGANAEHSAAGRAESDSRFWGTPRMLQKVLVPLVASNSFPAISWDRPGRRRSRRSPARA
jgi:hypothetical protein